ncbi:MAG: endonuclease/exonuclease/phosphatase family protein [Lachnospiraceae bacterium]
MKTNIVNENKNMENKSKYKIMEWNINGRTGYGGHYQIPVKLLVDTIQEEAPDIMVLVEFVKVNGYDDLSALLNEMGYSIFSTKYQRGRNGIAIIVRSELQPIYVEERIDMENSDKWPDYLKVDIDDLSIVGTRIRVDSDFSKRKEQLDLLLNRMEKSDKHFAVLGDYNNANIKNEEDMLFEVYDGQRQYYNYQMIWREVEKNRQWSLLTPDQGLGYNSQYSIVTDYKGYISHTKDDHMITDLPKELCRVCKYKWDFVNERNGYGKRNSSNVLSDLIGLPDHAILVTEVEV